MENQNPNPNINPFPDNNNPGSNTFVNQGQQNFGGGQQIPNATAVLVLGIVSIVLCGLIGIICAIISQVLAKKSFEAYHENPGLYSQSSFSNLKAGKICSTIGLVVGVLALIFSVVYIFMVMSALGRF